MAAYIKLSIDYPYSQNPGKVISKLANYPLCCHYSFWRYQLLFSGLGEQDLLYQTKRY